MISHEHKIIFIHIPKCAGTTIERVLFPKKQFNWREPDYENLHGWCPKNKLFLHQATAEQLLSKKLISENIWNEYLKIGIVRNPYSRAVSGYFWLMNNTQIRDSFRNYILRGGKFKSLLNDNSSNKFRGDHLWLQKDFLYFENKLVLDKLYFFENLDEIFNDLKKNVHLKNSITHYMKGDKSSIHYSNLFDDKTLQMFNEIYDSDLKTFNYSFEKEYTWDIIKNIKAFKYQLWNKKTRHY
jgi:hypothetical protein